MHEKNLLGIWDTSKSELNLGGLLTFVEELLIIKKLKSVKSVNIVITQNLISPINTNLLDLLKSLKNIKKIITDSKKKWPKDSFVYPENSDYVYNTSLFIQKYFRNGAKIIPLNLKPKVAAWAQEFLKTKVYPQKAVVVHLKNKPGNTVNVSNAVFSEWHKFFSRINNKKLKFILVGNEGIPQNFNKLPNVVLSRNFKSDLIKDLSLVSCADFFLGSASGICNMAIFSHIPYLIIKDPLQHPRQIQKELGNNDHFPFATNLQKIYRHEQKSEFILEKFNALYERH